MAEHFRIRAAQGALGGDENMRVGFKETGRIRVDIGRRTDGGNRAAVADQKPAPFMRGVAFNVGKDFVGKAA